MKRGIARARRGVVASRTSLRDRRRCDRAIAEALEGRALLATFQVLNADDAGPGSLRAAITSANGAATADLINFSPAFFNVPRTISLLSALPQFTAAGGGLTIAGPGVALLTVQRDPGAATNFRIFDSAAPTLSISGLTATGGNPSGFGGALSSIVTVGANVTIDSVVFTNNSPTSGGGAIVISSASFLTLLNSTISGNHAGVGSPGNGFGGGVDFSGSGNSLVVDNCTISGNFSGTSSPGGALYFGGTVAAAPPAGFVASTLVIRNSTLSGNTSGADGGAIALANNFTGTLLLQNSTFNGNIAAASGGAVAQSSGPGAITVQDCTISGNTANGTAVTGGGGIARTSPTAGTITLQNSIVSGNSNTNITSPDILAAAGTTTNVNFSAVGNNTGFTLSGSSGNNLAFGTALQLGPLQNNGGATLTLLPSDVSPLINAGSNALVPAILTTDQRGAGFPRTFGGTVDIGSVEVPSLLVKNANDSGIGSLRDAITQSIANTAADTIKFLPTFFNVSRTISLLTALPTMAASGGAVTIVGPGASILTVRRDPAALSNFRIFTSLASSLTMSGLTATGGNPSDFGGGLSAIAAGNIVTLDSVVFTGNTTTNGGGAIVMANAGFLSLRNSTVSNNTSGAYGGGVDFLGGPGGGAFVIDGCTISGNNCGVSVLSPGGGIYFGGAVSASPPPGFTAGALVIRNSTISGNTSSTYGGGVALGASSAFSGTLLVQNSTISGNTATSAGGGIAKAAGSGTITLVSSIVSGNTNAATPDISSSGTVNANFSAIGSALGFTLSGSSGNNLPFGTSLLLGPLQDNGGPTQTRLPQFASPLIDAGSNPAGLLTDQRGAGFPRVRNGAADIGAVETNTLLVTNLTNSAGGSLRDVVLTANATPGPDFITFQAGLSGPITLTSGEIAITESATIVGPGAAVVSVSGNDAGRIFNLTSAPLGTAVSISGLTMTHGLATGSGQGGAIFGDGQSLTLNGCVVSDSHANFGGGVEVIGDVTLTINDSTISGNTAAVYSGGIAASGVVVLRRSTISGNTARAAGGIYMGGTYGPAPSLLIDGCTISGNSATNAAEHGGGGIDLVGTFGAGALAIRNSTITGNTTAGTGGAGILLGGFGPVIGTLLVQDCTITGNTVSGIGSGGGIARQLGTTTITATNSIISGNSASSGPDISNGSTVNANFCAIGSNSGFALSGTSSGNLPFGLALLLGPLQNNGGPTFTMAPLPGSPLINSGGNIAVPAGLNTDQRGVNYARINAFAVDIGAVEIDATAPTLLAPTEHFVFNAPAQQLVYVFSENVSASLGFADLKLENLTTATTIPSGVMNLTYDPATNTATFTFPGFFRGILPDGNYKATLMPTPGGITDVSSNALATADIYPFFFFTGDIDHDRDVDVNDLNILAGNFGQSGKTFSQGNIDYSPDGLVDNNDLGLLSLHWQQSLAPPARSAEPIAVGKNPPKRVVSLVLDADASVSGVIG